MTPQLLPHIQGRPGGLGRVGVTGQPQLPVGHGPDVRLACRAEGGESLVPGGPLVGCLPGGRGADRVIGMVVAVHLPVRGDRGGLVFPVPTGGGACGNRAEGAGRPGRCGLGGVLAQAPGAVVHHRRDLGQVRAPVLVGKPGYSFGPGALGLREQRVDARADPGVQDGSNVAGSGQVAGGDGGVDDLGGVQACEFGGVQGAVQPAGLVRERLAVAGRKRGRDELAVPVVVGGLGFGGPDGVQGSEVVGVGQVVLPDHGGGLFGAVAAEDVGEHGDRLALARPVRAARRGLMCAVSRAFVAKTLVVVEFGGRPGAGLGVGGPAGVVNT
jgi:hypothetical protein